MRCASCWTTLRNYCTTVVSKYQILNEDYVVCQKLAYDKKLNTFQNECECCSGWLALLITDACSRTETNAKYTESRCSGVKGIFDQKAALREDSASIIPEFVKTLSEFLESLNNLFVWSEHFYNDWERFCEFCVKVTMNCHSTNSDKKPCPETLLQGFFVKSGTNRLKFEQINVQKFIKLDQMDLHWCLWHRHQELQKVSKVVTGIARASGRCWHFDHICKSPLTFVVMKKSR